MNFIFLDSESRPAQPAVADAQIHDLFRFLQERPDLRIRIVGDVDLCPFDEIAEGIAEMKKAFGSESIEGEARARERVAANYRNGLTYSAILVKMAEDRGFVKKVRGKWQRIKLERARFVAQALVQFGLNPKRILAVGPSVTGKALKVPHRCPSPFYALPTSLENRRVIVSFESEGDETAGP